MSAVADNLKRVQERIAAAAEQSGRRADEITLVAVTKKQPVSAVAEALAAGVADIGENYVQEGAAKQAALAQGCWHLLGHLQSNKAKAAVGAFDLIQSVDSVKLAQVVAAQAQAHGKRQNILLQVYLGDEATKSGIPPAQVNDIWAEAALQPTLNVLGLMGIAPNGVDPRPFFRELRGIFEGLPGKRPGILSMGMSGDFETAIEEGATMVRVGTAIFGCAIKKRQK